MKTNQIIESVDRELGGVIVAQRTKDSFLALQPLMSIINMQRLQQGLAVVSFWHFLQNENVSAFVAELEKETNAPVYYKATKSSRGWVHPFLAIKFLTHYNPKFEIQVYKWLFDYLIENRVKSSDSYLRMCGAIAKYAPNKAKIQKCIQFVANKIKDACGVDNWNNATQEQLKRRDSFQNLFADLAESLGDIQIAWRISLKTDSKKYDGRYSQIPLNLSYN